MIFDESIENEAVTFSDWKVELAPDMIWLDGASYSGLKLLGCYTHDFDFLLKLDNVDMPLATSGIFGFAEKDKVCFGETETELLRIFTQVMQNKVTDFEFSPVKSPSFLVSGGPVIYLKAKVLDGPSLFRQNRVLELPCGRFTVTYSEFEQVRKNRRDLQRKHKNIITGDLTIRRNDGEQFETNEGYSAASKVQTFLTFLNGNSASIGHFVGTDSEGDTVAFGPGFNKMGQFIKHTNWYGSDQFSDLLSLFEMYLQFTKDDEQNKIFRRVLSFYQASTAIRDSSMEMAIVASSAALEVAVPYILRTRAAMDGNLLGERIPFHSKLRSCFGVLGLSCDPFEGLETLKNKAKSLNDPDAYEMSTMFRNRIVHQGRQFSVNGSELHEMWNLQMWMIELLIFAMLGYHGTMHDRRPTSGWRGGADPVPLRRR